MKIIKKVFSYAIVWICLAIIVTVILSVSLILFTIHDDKSMHHSNSSVITNYTIKAYLPILLIHTFVFFACLACILMIYIKTYREDQE